MTEAEWLAGAEPKPMLEYIWGKVSERKLRLFRCACCRRFELSGTLQWAVDLAERYADGLIGREEFEGGRAACNFEDPLGKAVAFAVWPTAHDPAQENRMACARLAWQLVVPWFHGQQEKTMQVLRAESNAQSALLRDVIGNPFRPAAIDRSWLRCNGDAIPTLAQVIYDERAYDGLPILADALEHAGCANGDILSHCRGPGPHVRGCWVVDLLLETVHHPGPTAA